MMVMAAVAVVTMVTFLYVTACRWRSADGLKESVLSCHVDTSLGDRHLDLLSYPTGALFVLLSQALSLERRLSWLQGAACGPSLLVLGLKAPDTTLSFSCSCLELDLGLHAPAPALYQQTISIPT